MLIHGQLSHKAGSLLPPDEGEDQSPKYSQLYIYDPAEALDYRMDHQANSGLDRQVMQVLQDMLYRRHPGVQVYKQAYELTQNMEPQKQCKIALRYDNACDRRRYNLPTAAASNELAIILPGDGDQPDSGRDIVVYRRSGSPLQRINDVNPFYLPLHYVLLFPTGQPGWHPKIPYNLGEEIPEENDGKR